MFRPSRSIVRWAAAQFIAVAALAVLVMPGLAEAQQRGDTQATQETLPFASGRQSVWGRGASTLETFNFHLFDATFGASLDEGVSETWLDLEVGGSVDMTAGGSMGLDFEMESLGEGALRVTYPVGASIVFPAPNSFAPGDPVTILTAWSLEDGAGLSSEAPEHVLSLNGPFSASSTVGGEICIGLCYDQPSVGLDQSPVALNFFSVGDAGIGAGDQFVEFQEWEFGFVEKFLLGISGSIENPREYPSGTPTGSSISASTRQQWMDINWDLDTFLSRIGILQAPGGLGVNTGDIAIGYNFWDLDQDLNFHHARRFDFDATPQVSVSFEAAMAWFVNDEGGDQIDAGMGTAVSFDVGHSLTVIFPGDRTDPISAQPTYTLPNTLESYGAWEYAGNMRDTLLSAELKIPAYNGWGEEWKDEGTYKKKSCPSVNYDDWGVPTNLGTIAECELEHAWSWAKRAGSSWWKWVSDWVLKPVSNWFGTVDQKWGPEHADIFAEFSATEVYHDTSWELEGFGALDGTAFSLDPENPSIGVMTSFENTLMTGGADAGTVMQTMVVTNTGDIRLDAASVMDAMNANGITVEMIQSFDMTANGTFDGQGVSETLAAGQTIPVGGSAEITIRVASVPGLHTAAVHAAGTSPISARVVTADAGGSFGWYSLDIKPDKLNRKSKGKLPVELYGSPTLDVRLVDWATVRLEGVAPVKIEFEDEDGDDDEEDEGFYGPHLEFKFERQDILAGMDARLAATTPVAAPAPIAAVQFTLTSQQVADALLGFAGPGVDITAMDRAGNGNGMLDVGDLRAALMAEGVVLAAGKKDKDKTNENHEEHEDDEEDDDPGIPTILVLTGSLTDGTPFWAEGSVLIKEEN